MKPILVQGVPPKSLQLAGVHTSLLSVPHRGVDSPSSALRGSPRGPMEATLRTLAPAEAVLPDG